MWAPGAPLAGWPSELHPAPMTTIAATRTARAELPVAPTGRYSQLCPRRERGSGLHREIVTSLGCPRYGLQTPVEVSIFQVVAQVVETVVPLMVNGSQM